MSNPRFRVLDVVSLAGAPAESWGTVTEVRRYRNGQVRYCVSRMAPDGVGTIFDEGDLGSTGLRANLSEFRIIGGFSQGAVVKVRSTSALVEIAGKSGIVVGGSAGAESIGVLIDDLGHVWCVPPSDLEATGQERREKRPKRATSLRIDQAGGLLGSDEYEVLEDVSDL